jgi:hypothetical protein
MQNPEGEMKEIGSREPVEFIFRFLAFNFRFRSSIFFILRSAF